MVVINEVFSSSPFFCLLFFLLVVLHIPSIFSFSKRVSVSFSHVCHYHPAHPQRCVCAYEERERNEEGGEKIQRFFVEVSPPSSPIPPLPVGGSHAMNPITETSEAHSALYDPR